MGHINHGMERIKNNSEEIHFRHYSMLMHMLLYVGQGMNLWVDNLRVMEYDKKGLRKPVQIWTTIWDQRCPWSQYLCFEEYFVKTLCQLLGRSCDYTLTPKIQRFLRPKEYDKRQIVNHNWGD